MTRLATVPVFLLLFSCNPTAENISRESARETLRGDKGEKDSKKKNKKNDKDSNDPSGNSDAATIAGAPRSSLPAGAETISLGGAFPPMNADGSVRTNASAGNGVVNAATNVCDAGGTVSQTRVRRLSNREMINTINAVFGRQLLDSDILGPDLRLAHFENNAVINRVNDQNLSYLVQMATQVADAAVVGNGAFFSCSIETTISSDCLNGFLGQFVQPLFRRTLNAGDRNRILEQLALYRAKLENSESEALKGLVKYLVLSPDFLYRTEMGPEQSGDTIVTMTPFEVASAISYALTEGPPDALLFQAAQNNQLTTQKQLADQVIRILQTERSSDTLTRMVSSIFSVYKYYSIKKDQTVFEDFNESLPAAFEAEANALIRSVIWDNNGGVRELLTSPSTFINQDLQSIYGLQNLGQEVEKIDLPQGRMGILTTPGHLALKSHDAIRSPFHRGTFVLKELQCRELGNPPPGAADATLPEGPNLVTFREKLEAMTEGPTCIVCHQFLNPAGFAFEKYNGLGQLQLTDNGASIDDSGVYKVDGVDKAFSGGKEFIQNLADSTEVARCSVIHSFRFIEGRNPETASDSCQVDQVMSQLGQNNMSIKNILLQLLADPRRYTRRKI